MSEPRRLRDEGGDDLGSSLLRSAREDAPSPHARQKAMIALGLASGVGATLTAATTTGAASTLAKSSAGAALLKWIGVGVIGGIVTVGTVEIVQQSKSAPATAQPAASAPPAEPVKVVKGAPIAATEAPVAEPPAPTAEPAAPAPTAVEEAPPKPVVEAPKASARPAEKPSLADEVAALDAAREALRAGNGSAALRALDDHDRRFRGGMLAMEATVMRIEALVLRGDRATASLIGRAFLDSHPQSPHAPRVRSLLGIPEEP